MVKYQIELLDGRSNEIVEASFFRLADGHFIFFQKTSSTDRPVFAIPAAYVRTIRIATS